MIIYFGADHRGFELKQKVIDELRQLGHEVHAVGALNAQDACDYPPIAEAVAAHVVGGGPDARGILLCMTGIGLTIAANKVPGAYAALAYNQEAAVLSRQHNNANILVLGAKFVDDKAMMGIVRAWLAAPFEGGRHLRRFEQIQAIENKFSK